VKYANPLTKRQREKLETFIVGNFSIKEVYRGIAVLMSSNRITIDKISVILGFDRDTISKWIDKWNLFGIKGLKKETRAKRKTSAASANPQSEEQKQ